MFKIGMRTLKSSAAVFICLIINYYVIKSNYPFYSAIAAVLCMQQDIQNSFKTGLNRMTGTIIGGIFGVIVLSSYKYFLSFDNIIIYYLIVSICIIPIIHITVLLNKKSSSYITCVVFLSIVITHGEDMSVFLFAFHRVIDTFIGIAVSICVNTFIPYTKPDKNILFVSDLDGTLLNSNKEVSKYTSDTLNNLIKKGLNFTIATARTPATSKEILKNINFNLPIICMNGSAIYDLKNDKYINFFNIAPEHGEIILNIINNNNINCFIHAIENNHLYVYYKNLNNEAEKVFFEERKNLKLKTYIKGLPKNLTKTLYIMVLERKDIVKSIYNKIKELEIYKELEISMYEDIYLRGFYFLEIYNKNASKKNAVLYLKEKTNCSKTVVFGDSQNDLSMIKIADISFAVENADENIKKHCSNIIESNNSNSVAKTIKNFN